MEIKIFTTLGELEGIASEWDMLALASEHKSPVLSHIWISCYLEINCPPGSWLVVAAFDEQGLCAILPLVKQTGQLLFVKTEFLQLPKNNQTLSVDGLVRQGSEPVLAKLFAAAFQHCPQASYIQYARIDKVSRSLAWIEQNKWVLASTDISAYGAAIELQGNYAEYLANLKKKFRANLATSRNRIKEMTAVEYIYSETGILDKELLELMFVVENSGWKGQAGTSILSDKKTAEFYRLLAQKLNQKGWLSLQLLRCEEAVLAGHYAINFGDATLLWKLGYSDAHAKASPGSLLMDDLIQRRYESGGYHRIDLMTYEGWYDNWNMVKRPFYDAWVFRTSLKGLMLSLLIKGRLYAAQLKQRFGKKN